MADKPKRKLRPAQTVREQSEAANVVQPPKKQRRSKLAKTLVWPFRKLASFLGRYRALRFIGRIIVPTYFRSSWAEIKQVTWPSRRETRRLTMAVLGFAIVFGALVASLDYGLGHLFRIIILGKHH